MIFNALTTAAATAIMASSLAGHASACAPPTHPSNTTGGPPGFELGSDTPADPATLGYYSNHISLNVRNLTASIDFYARAFGYRHIFTMQPSDSLRIAYLGHSQGGRNGTGYQTAAELSRDKNNLAGLLEMISIDVDLAEGDLPKPSSERTNTFGHVGMIVPDIEAAQARLEALGDVEILKRCGEPIPRGGKLAMAQGFSPEVVEKLGDEFGVILEVMDVLNDRFVFVVDPDGNIVEIQPREE